MIWIAITSEIGADKEPYDHEVVYFAIWAIQSDNFFKQWLVLSHTTPSLAPNLNQLAVFFQVRWGPCLYRPYYIPPWLVTKS